MKQPKTSGLDIELHTVATKDQGAIYQLVEGDPTNQEYREALEKNRREAATEAG